MRLFAFLAVAAITRAAAFAEVATDSVGRPIMMFVLFRGFDRVVNLETKQQEYVFAISFPGLDIPAQPLLLRRGDRVAGYIIGQLKNPEPKIAANDGIIPGTETTLELIHAASGEKYALVLGKIYRVPRERSQLQY